MVFILILNYCSLKCLFAVLVILNFGCKASPSINTRREFSKQLSLPIFSTILSRHQTEKKILHLLIKTENISEKPIQNLQILFFAFEENGNILIPEEQKTPELLCVYEKEILPKTKRKCHVGPHVFPKNWSSIRLTSISFSTSDKTRHFISESDLDDVTEWETN